MKAQPVTTEHTEDGWIAYTDTHFWKEIEVEEATEGLYLFNHTSKHGPPGIYEVPYFVRFTTFNQPVPCEKEEATHIYLEEPGNDVWLYAPLEHFEQIVEQRREVPVKLVR